jgi:hypothetical protein
VHGAHRSADAAAADRCSGADFVVMRQRTMALTRW